MHGCGTVEVDCYPHSLWVGYTHIHLVYLYLLFQLSISVFPEFGKMLSVVIFVVYYSPCLLCFSCFYGDCYVEIL